MKKAFGYGVALAICVAVGAFIACGFPQPKRIPSDGSGGGTCTFDQSTLDSCLQGP